ncbi:hypothetical protein L596_024686 [Steinernema carpocapsae]|uniref:Uncharacterized protein n=1 Tax=Steinernema carpocapsae TaxID=34508 RepID=A0A4U5M5G5_STECR|nr:hypothetical protein L596_024686 [Steinernema carpocapsae]
MFTFVSQKSLSASKAVLLALVVVCVMSSVSSSRIFKIQDESIVSKPKCEIHGNNPLHVVMDRVCLMCHEMYSHERPNMRMECRMDCFRTENFRNCLKIFSPADRQSQYA